jgi:hypothetical protein
VCSAHEERRRAAFVRDKPRAQCRAERTRQRGRASGITGILSYVSLIETDGSVWSIADRCDDQARLRSIRIRFNLRVSSSKQSAVRPLGARRHLVHLNTAGSGSWL